MLSLCNFLTQCLIFSITVYIIQCVVRHFRYYSLATKLPGPSMLTIPMVLDPLHIVKNKLNALHTLHEYHNKYGDIFRVFLPDMSVVLTKPEHIQMLCTSQDLLNKSDQYSSLAEIMGHTTLLSANGDVFRRSKKVFYKTFVGQDIKYAIDAFYRGAADLAKNFDRHVGGPWFQAGEYIIEASLANVIRGVYRLEPQEVPEAVELTKKTDFVLKYMMLRSWTPLFKYDIVFNLTPPGRKIRNMIHEARIIITNVMETRRKEYADILEEKNGPIPNQTAYTIYKERKEDPQFIVHDTTTVVTTASDTSALTLGHILHLLGMHPDIQEKVFEEDDRIQKELGGRQMVESDFKSYEYLKRVIQETLRINPTVPFFSRLVEKDIKIGEYTVPKGCNLVVFLTALHRNPKVFPEPLRFDPDRFLPENMEKLQSFQYLPFSHGQRICPGAQYGLKAVMFMTSAVIRRYKVFSFYKSIEEWDRNLTGTITLNDVNHFPIRLEARSP